MLAFRVDPGAAVSNESEKVDRSEIIKFLVSNAMKSGLYPAGDEELWEDFKQLSDVNLFYIEWVAI